MSQDVKCKCTKCNNTFYTCADDNNKLDEDLQNCENCGCPMQIVRPETADDFLVLASMTLESGNWHSINIEDLYEDIISSVEVKLTVDTKAQIAKGIKRWCERL